MLDGHAQPAILLYIPSMKTLSRILKSHHCWGLLGTGAAMYLLLVLVGKIDVGWMMPDTQRLAREIIKVWPQMPFFAVAKEPAKDGQGEVIYYTVPTRQFTPQELAQMGVTNATAHPAQPR